MDYGRRVQFGYFIIPDATQPTRALDQAIRADEAGIELIGIQDHPYQHRFYDTWTLLSVVAARTSRVTVFPDVANLPLRPPAMLAKAAATLDLLSNGRVELGLGAGGFWPAIGAMGGPVRTPGESVSAVEEAIEGRTFLSPGWFERRTGATASHRHLARGLQAEDAPPDRACRGRLGTVARLLDAGAAGRGWGPYR